MGFRELRSDTTNRRLKRRDGGSKSGEGNLSVVKRR